MTITREIKLKDFTFWSGAVANRRKLTDEECDKLEQFIEDLGDEPWSATELNDAMWFDFENICDWLSLDYEEVMARKDD